jgi:hypothetical protein
MTQEELREIKDAAQRTFGGLDGVEGFGIGDQQINVYVRNESVGQRLPERFRGVRMEKVETGDIIAAAE